MDFDETRLYYSHQQLQEQQSEPLHESIAVSEDDSEVDLNAVQRHFREFLSKFYTVYIYCIYLCINACKMCNIRFLLNIIIIIII